MAKPKGSYIVVKSETQLRAIVGRDYRDVLQSLKKNGIILDYSVSIHIEVTQDRYVAFQAAMAFDEAKHPNNAPNPRKESQE